MTTSPSTRSYAAAGAAAIALVLAAVVPASPSGAGIALAGSTVEDQVPDLLVYTGPLNAAAFGGRYGASCGNGSCVFETSPADAPLQKAAGGPVCLVARYESKAVATAFFSRDGSFEGIACEIDSTLYHSISQAYGRVNIVRRYLDQRVYEDFVTWKTTDGFLTTYTEILGRAPGGSVMRAYRVYAGRQEHRHYSEYPVE